MYVYGEHLMAHGGPWPSHQTVCLLWQGFKANVVFRATRPKQWLPALLIQALAYFMLIKKDAVFHLTEG